LAAVFYSALAYDFGNVSDWANTFVATALTVGAGVLLYRHQTDRADEERVDQLLTALAGELQSCLNILRARPSPLRVPTGAQLTDTGALAFTFGDLGHVVLVRLPMVVVVEALRSAKFDADDSFLLSNIAGHIQVHNSEVDFILSARQVLVTRVMLISLQQTMVELKQRQADIASDCEALLKHLASQGIPMPDAGPADRSNW
jgi:Ni/Fe-hydrogenase subunit HybB-like protein